MTTPVPTTSTSEIPTGVTTTTHKIHAWKEYTPWIRESDLEITGDTLQEIALHIINRFNKSGRAAETYRLDFITDHNGDNSKITLEINGSSYQSGPQTLANARNIYIVIEAIAR